MKTEYEEDEFLQLSGLQHFVFCPRQWALIHLEQQWTENVRTAEGRILHEKAHDSSTSEKRGSILILRDMRVQSPKLGIFGACDVVEFHASPAGVSLHGRKGLWLPFPIEYKRGQPKTHQADELQLCAQAMCLEEMLCCSITEGALFYGETRRRELIAFTKDMREMVECILRQMHDYAARGHTPKVKPTKACDACSLKDLCLPRLHRCSGARSYLRSAIREVQSCENS